MKKKIISLIISMFCMCLFTGCQCEHEWLPANCTTPATCSLCGETEGEPLSHQWKSATCTEANVCSLCGETSGEALGHVWLDANCYFPKMCNRCELTEGNALDHTPGDWVEATDYIKALTSREQFCTACEQLISSETVPLESLTKDQTFLCTPREFMDRFVYIASDTMESPTYSILEDQESLRIGVSSGDTRYSVFAFYDSDANILEQSDFDSANIGAFSFSYVFKMGPLTWAPEMDEFPDFTVMIQGDQFAEALFRTCEPAADKEATYYFQTIGFTAGTGIEDWVETDTYMLESETGIEYYISQAGASDDLVQIMAICA